ncbi:MAG: 23S rRNA (adenine(2503)-C(2))-methyltransferase RlmN [Planctomycetota bacterium]
MSLSELKPSGKIHFLGLDGVAAETVVREWGWKPFRAKQILEWVYRRHVDDPAKMMNLPFGDRKTLAERAVFLAGRIARQEESRDGTRKLLIEFSGGRSVETVMIPEEDRRTACVSSQAGCPVGCRFCASGRAGLQGNLFAGEIVEQVWLLDRDLAAGQKRLTNIVFMGMGEPLANYQEVVAAVRVLRDPRVFGLGARRITISTVGIPDRIRALAEEDLGINLAVSLHAPDDRLRRELIPWAEHFSLGEVLDAAGDFFKKTGREVTLEYVLLAGVNDRPGHAAALAKTARKLRANVNLIRYNAVQGLPYRRPEAAAALGFQEALRTAGVNVHLRRSRGPDIRAACGQLRLAETEKRRGNFHGDSHQLPAR